MYIDRLLDEHCKLRALAADLVALVASNEPCDPDELARRRWDLARMVHQHLAYEERQLFCRLDTDPRPSARAAALSARKAIEAMHACYKAHVERWTPGKVKSHWSDFQIAVKALAARMAHALDREESDLFPLMANEEALKPRWRRESRNWAGDGIALEPLIKAQHLVGHEPMGGVNRITFQPTPRAGR